MFVGAESLCRAGEGGRAGLYDDLRDPDLAHFLWSSVVRFGSVRSGLRSVFVVHDRLVCVLCKSLL